MIAGALDEARSTKSHQIKGIVALALHEIFEQVKESSSERTSCSDERVSGSINGAKWVGWRHAEIIQKQPIRNISGFCFFIF